MNEDLINLVERYEELYNQKHKHYNNQQRRDNIWDAIGKIMDESGRTCKERWTKIRDNHRKALQLRKTKRGKAAIKIKPPKYNKELKFLLPYLQDIKPSSSIPITESSIDHITKTERSSLDSPLSIVISPIASPQCDSLDSQNWSAKNGIRRESSRNADEISTAPVLKEYLEHGASVYNTHVNPNAVSYSDEQDPLIGFFINMARTVKTFPIQEQIKLKNEVFSIVNDTELRLAMQ